MFSYCCLGHLDGYTYATSGSVLAVYDSQLAGRNEDDFGIVRGSYTVVVYIQENSPKVRTCKNQILTSRNTCV